MMNICFIHIYFAHISANDILGDYLDVERWNRTAEELSDYLMREMYCYLPLKLLLQLLQELSDGDADFFYCSDNSVKIRERCLELLRPFVILCAQGNSDTGCFDETRQKLNPSIEIYSPLFEKVITASWRSRDDPDLDVLKRIVSRRMFDTWKPDTMFQMLTAIIPHDLNFVKEILMARY